MAKAQTWITKIKKSQKTQSQHLAAIEFYLDDCGEIDLSTPIIWQKAKYYSIHQPIRKLPSVETFGKNSRTSAGNFSKNKTKHHCSTSSKNAIDGTNIAVAGVV